MTVQSLGRDVDKLLKAAGRTRKLALPKAADELLRQCFPEFFPLREFQSASLDNKKPSQVIVVHRRGGKSVKECMKLVRSAVGCPHPDGRFSYVGPTKDQVKDIAWHYLVKAAERLPGTDCKETAREIYFPTLRGHTSRIKLYGLDNPRQPIRGLYQDGAVLDELQDLPESVYTEQIRPALSDPNRAGVDDFGYPCQWVDMIGTPKGRLNILYEYYQKAKAWQDGKPFVLRGVDGAGATEVYSDAWAAEFWDVYSTGVYTPEEIDKLRADMPVDKFEQEFACKWDAAIKGAIYKAALVGLRNRGRIGRFPINRNLPVNTAWDLGVDNATAVVLWQDLNKQEAVVVGGVDFGHTTFVNIVAQLEADARTRGYRFGYHCLPHDANVFELGRGHRWKQLKELGVWPQVGVKKYPGSKEDGISATLAALPDLLFDETHCRELIEALEFYHRDFDEKNRVDRPAPVHDWSSDYADAFRTMVVGRAIGFSRYGRHAQSSDRPGTAEL